MIRPRTRSASVSPWLSRLVARPRPGLVAGASSGSEAEFGVDAPLKSLEAAERQELRHVGFAAEVRKHPGEVGGRRDRRAEALADRFARRRAAQVVVTTARAGRLGD